MAEPIRPTSTKPSRLQHLTWHYQLASYEQNNLLNQQKEIIKFVADPAQPVWDKDAIERRLRAIQSAAETIWSLDVL